MKIIVLTKEVPDTYTERRLDPTTGVTDRAASPAVADEIGERALEVALAFADRTSGTEVVVLSLGPATVPATLRKLLAMGATSAIHVLDDDLRGADLVATARALSAAISAAGFDLVIAGNVSTDGNGGVIAAMVAEHLAVPHLTNLIAVTVEDSGVSGVRATEREEVTVQADLPAVISIAEALPDARFASFKGIMAAKKKPFQTWSLDDLVLAKTPAAASIVLSVAQPAERPPGVTIVDDGDAGIRLAAFLVDNGLA